jgi:6-phosphogluconate dehydrogenase
MPGGLDIGMVGLGVMGRNLLLNIADHGFRGAGFDTDATKLAALHDEAGQRPLYGATSLAELVSWLRPPRAVVMLVPAGPPVDTVIREIMPHLEPGDIVVDGGNSYYGDTELRARALAGKGVHFLGMGVSGGEHGARRGPSLMPGGPREAYESLRPILEAIAARADGIPCVAYLGPGASGHYVKMVHNGIEYALMRLIAETYEVLKWGLELTDEELHHVYDTWNQGELSSYLLEITAQIFARVDEVTGKPLIDVILDEARQKGTGKWTVQDAMDLGVPVPTISIAVAMRDLSALKSERLMASRALSGPEHSFRGDRKQLLEQLRSALYACTIVAFAQGMAQLRAASVAHGFGLDLGEVARIWEAGCIIRADLLKQIRSAYQARPDLPNLLLDDRLGREIMARQTDLRAAVQAAAASGISTPAMMCSLGYYDAYRSAWSSANLIEAQRDYFGAHTYERIDSKGTFHTHWSED